MRILIVEDEFNLADVIKSRLEKEKYVVDICTDGLDGLYNLLTGVYDLVILDVMLPGMDGFLILDNIKNKNINTKVIMLTAKSSLENKLMGLKNGCDDYLTKPFHIEELVARVNIQLKKDNSSNVLKYKDLVLDLNTSTLLCSESGNKVELVCKELRILEYLINNCEHILSKEQIYDKVWGIDNEVESNGLEAYMSFIRKKINAIGSNVSIKSVRGLGYKMEYKDE